MQCRSEVAEEPAHEWIEPVVVERRSLRGGHEREAIPIVLHHFDLDEATTFLADQGLRRLEPDLVLALLKVTGGNPLFLRRIAALGAPDPHRALPAGLRVAIDQALATLSPQAQQILGASAVLGLMPAVSEASAVSGARPRGGARCDRRGERRGTRHLVARGGT